jgi:hypothetical protein
MMAMLGVQPEALLPLAPTAETAAPTSTVGTAAEAIVLRLLNQLIAIFVATRLVVAAARCFGQTTQ